MFRAGAGLTAGERAGLEADVKALRRWLRPASAEEVSAAIVPVLLAFPSADTGDYEVARAAMYAEALAPYPGPVLARLRREAAAGGIPDTDPRWAPTPAQMATRARALVSAPASELAEAVAWLTAEEEQRKPDRTPKPLGEGQRASLAAIIGGGRLAELERQAGHVGRRGERLIEDGRVAGGPEARQRRPGAEA